MRRPRRRAWRQRMVQRARWWYAAGGLVVCPTEAQLTAAVQPWRPRLALPLPGKAPTNAGRAVGGIDVPVATWTTDRVGPIQRRTSTIAHGWVLFLFSGGAGRAPNPDKSGFPSAYGLHPSSKTDLSELSKIGRVWIGPDRVTLPWLGLPLPTSWLVTALRRSDRPETTRWLLQLLLPEPELLDRVLVDLPVLAAAAERVRAMDSQAGLPGFFRRSAQISLADLAWFSDHDVRRSWPTRAWPPAADHFPIEVHGHRAVRAVRALRESVRHGTAAPSVAHPESL